MRRGDVFRHDQPGPGGWGDPLEREPARVLRDVRNELVSLALGPRRLRRGDRPRDVAVDEAATSRAARRAARGPRLDDGARRQPLTARQADATANSRQSPGTPFEHVAPAVVEPDAGARHQVLDRARHQHLLGPRRRRDSRAGVHGDAADFDPASSHSPVCSPARTSRPSGGPRRGSRRRSGSRAPGRRRRRGGRRPPRRSRARGTARAAGGPRRDTRPAARASGGHRSPRRARSSPRCR